MGHLSNEFNVVSFVLIMGKEFIISFKTAIKNRAMVDLNGECSNNAAHVYNWIMFGIF